MAVAIETKGLTKDYRSPIKEPGLWGGVKSLFDRKYKNTRAVEMRGSVAVIPVVGTKLLSFS